VQRTATTASTRQKHDDDDDLEAIQRVLVTCTPERVVDLVRVENPQAAKLDYRLRHPHEYLRATVRPRNDKEEAASSDNDVIHAALCQRIQQDYKAVRQFYLDGVGTDDLPPFSRDRLVEVLPEIAADDLATPPRFWKVADFWQTLCETVKEGRQLSVLADRNELLVAAAVRRGGILQLPVHVEDVEPADRQRVQELEETAQRLWLDVRLDPCVDFQRLLAAERHGDRLRLFAAMVARERMRLEELASVRTRTSPSEETSSSSSFQEADAPPRKGAWFEDGW